MTILEKMNAHNHQRVSNQLALILAMAKTYFVVPYDNFKSSYREAEETPSSALKALKC